MPGNAINNLLNIIDRKYKITFIATCVIGVLTHMFMLTNILPGNDQTMFYFNLGGTRSFGRWGLYVLEMPLPIINTSILACYGMPWVKGCISIVLLAITACVAVSIMDIHNDSLCILAGATIVTFPSVAATFSYMFTSSSYFFGLLLSCLAVYVIRKILQQTNAKKLLIVIGVILSSCLLMLSLSIYQSYICFAIGLFVIDLILQILKRETSFKEVLIKSFLYLIVIVLGLVFYYISIQIMLAFFWPTLSSYQGIGEMLSGDTGSILETIFSGISKAYIAFFDVPFTMNETLELRRMLYFILGGGYYFRNICISKKKRGIFTLENDSACNTFTDVSRSN